jgi:tRNA (mo5U34)-methyltransferase
MRNSCIEGLIAKHNDWYHRIKLPFGLETPSIADTETKMKGLSEIGLAHDCSNKRVLDVGCMDGFFSFETEKRGASVVAMDRAPFEGTKIQTAIQCLNSLVEYRSGNVYYLNSKDLRIF